MLLRPNKPNFDDDEEPFKFLELPEEGAGVADDVGGRGAGGCDAAAAAAAAAACVSSWLPEPADTWKYKHWINTHKIDDSLITNFNQLLNY